MTLAYKYSTVCCVTWEVECPHRGVRLHAVVIAQRRELHTIYAVEGHGRAEEYLRLLLAPPAWVYGRAVVLRRQGLEFGRVLLAVATPVCVEHLRVQESQYTSQRCRSVAYVVSYRHVRVSRVGRSEGGARGPELLCGLCAHLLHSAARIQEALVYATHISSAGEGGAHASNQRHTCTSDGQRPQ